MPYRVGEDISRPLSTIIQRIEKGGTCPAPTETEGLGRAVQLQRSEIGDEAEVETSCPEELDGLKLPLVDPVFEDALEVTGGEIRRPAVGVGGHDLGDPVRIVEPAALEHRRQGSEIITAVGEPGGEDESDDDESEDEVREAGAEETVIQVSVHDVTVEGALTATSALPGYQEQDSSDQPNVPI